jgi:heat shock protein HslJ
LPGVKSLAATQRRGDWQPVTGNTTARSPLLISREHQQQVVSFDGRFRVVGDPSTPVIVCFIDFDREHQQRQSFMIAWRKVSRGDAATRRLATGNRQPATRQPATGNQQPAEKSRPFMYLMGCLHPLGMMRSMKQLIYIPFLLLTAFSSRPGEGTFGPGGPTQVQLISGQKWFLTTLYRSDGFTQLLDRQVHISIQTDKNAAGGNAGCNSYGASVSVDSSTINFRNIFSTKMYCEEMQETENDYLANLRQVTRYEIKGKKLLMYAGDRLLLEFESPGY